MIEIGKHKVTFIEILTVRQGQVLYKIDAKRKDKKTDYDNMDLSNDLIGLIVTEIDGKTNKKDIESYILDGGVSVEVYAEIAQKVTKQLEMLQKKKKAQ